MNMNRPKFKMLVDGPKLTNDSGVSINAELFGHYSTTNAFCKCGEPLMVAPLIFNPSHKPGDPVMVCSDHGVHDYRFKDLIKGKQLEYKEED